MTFTRRAVFALVCLRAVEAATTYISDTPITVVANGWGPVEKDLSNGERESSDGRSLSIRGATFRKGLGTHAPAEVLVSVPPSCTTFQATVGIDDEVRAPASVIFQVWADGVKLSDTGVLTGASAARTLSLGISGRSELRLVVTDGGDGARNDHADWADARLACGQVDSPSVAPLNSAIVSPGDDLQSVINQQPTGGTIILNAGVYRLQRVQPKAGQTLIGQPGAILNGARLLSNFVRHDSVWITYTQPFQAQPTVGTCAASAPRCSQAETLFLDNVALRAVSSPSELQPGSWYLDYHSGTVYMADDPSGRTVELSVLRNAIYGSASNVTIKGLIVEKYANPAETGAIHALTDPGPYSKNWRIESNEIRLNHGAAVRIADGTQVIRNNIHHNGQSGIIGGGVGVLVDGNEISYNNTAGFDYSWNAGGTKFIYTTGLVVRGNYVHHNGGPGLWTDGENSNVTYENNRTSDNVACGICHETGYDAVIRNNTVTHDGFTAGASLWYGAGVFVSASLNVEIYGNTVTNSQNGIGAAYIYRGSIGRPYPLQNLNVHDNTIIQNTGTAAGIVSNDPVAFTGWNNRFERNTYQLANPSGAYFEWNGSRTAAAWRSFGQDVSGVFR